MHGQWRRQISAYKMTGAGGRLTSTTEARKEQEKRQGIVLEEVQDPRDRSEEEMIRIIEEKRRLINENKKQKDVKMQMQLPAAIGFIFQRKKGGYKLKTQGFNF